MLRQLEDDEGVLAGKDLAVRRVEERVATRAQGGHQALDHRRQRLRSAGAGRGAGGRRRRRALTVQGKSAAGGPAIALRDDRAVGVRLEWRARKVGEHAAEQPAAGQKDNTVGRQRARRRGSASGAA